MKVLAFVALAACGRLDFAALTDANSDAGACLGTGPFTNIQPVAAIDNSDGQYGTFLSPDGLTLLWDQSDGTHERLYASHRLTRGDAFPAGDLIPGTFPAADQAGPTVTGDGLELYFDSNVAGSLCVHRATRTSTALPFDPPVELSALCSAGPMTGPSISADGLTLVYNSALDGSDGDLYLSVRTQRSEEFPAGKKLLGLPTLIGYPALSADRLRIWFEQAQPDGSFEIVGAVRISPSDVFSQLHALDEIDTDGSEADVSLTLDESEIAFVSKRAGSFDAFIASRPCL